MSTSLTIGSFDGLHLGHQKVIKHITQYPTSTLLTFTNHPLSVLPGKTPPKLLCRLEHKLHLLKQTPITQILLFPFTPALSQESYDVFLTRIHKTYPFTALILGQGALLGHNREGTPEKLYSLGLHLGFTVTYISPYLYEAVPVSSGRIRNLVQTGDLYKVKELLGRPYSLYGTLKNGTLDLQGLCHPPPGSYLVSINNCQKQAYIENHTLHMPFSCTSPVTVTFTVHG